MTDDGVSFRLGFVKLRLELADITLCFCGFALDACSFGVQLAESSGKLLLQFALFNNRRFLRLFLYLPPGAPIFGAFIGVEIGAVGELLALASAAVEKAFYIVKSALVIAALY